jgi:hypothetical protein
MIEELNSTLIGPIDQNGQIKVNLTPNFARNFIILITKFK